jgi:hypothetical protein
VKDTEQTGGTRYSEGKPAGWWFAPLLGLRLLAGVWTGGSEKYAPLDWQEGQSFSTLLNCTGRHWLEVVHYGPWAKCPDSGCYHLAHMAWNILCLLTFMVLIGRDEEKYGGVDDVTRWRGITATEAKKEEYRGWQRR